MKTSPYPSVSNKYVCPDCIYEHDDATIEEFIMAHAIALTCSYCHKSLETPHAAPLDEVIEFIVEGIQTEWGNPRDPRVFSHDDDHWSREYFDTTYELLSEYLEIEIHPLLLRDICEVLSHSWCAKRFQSESEHLLISWDIFSAQVMYATRYMFSYTYEFSDPYLRGYIPPAQMLNTIGQIISKLNLVEIVPAGTKFYRARITGPDENLPDKVDEIAPPPHKKAKYPNRMSPAGIPMFYGAYDENTAIAEVYRYPHIGYTVTVGKFVTLQDLRVLDLTDIPAVPSLFNHSKRDLRANISFLADFAQEVSRPIAKNETEAEDYIPTQVFTEFIRHVYRYDNQPIHGITYHSAVHPGGKCCVLFFEQEQCCDEDTSPDESKWLQLKQPLNHFRFSVKPEVSGIQIIWEMLEENEY